jgi:AcrR family transcriptional regulator
MISNKMEEQQNNSYHHEGLKQAVIDMSLAIVKENGHDALSLREVAERCGVSRSAPYKHFKDKNELLLEIAITGFDRLSKAMRKTMTETGDNTAENLKALCFNYVSFAIKHQNLYLLMYSKSLSKVEHQSRLVVAKMKSLVWIGATIDHGVKAENITLETRELVMGHLWSHVHGLTMLVLDNGATDETLSRQVKSFVEASVDLLFLGLFNDKTRQSPIDSES